MDYQILDGLARLVSNPLLGDMQRREAAQQYTTQVDGAYYNRQLVEFEDAIQTVGSHASNQFRNVATDLSENDHVRTTVLDSISQAFVTLAYQCSDSRRALSSSSPIKVGKDFNPLQSVTTLLGTHIKSKVEQLIAIAEDESDSERVRLNAIRNANMLFSAAKNAGYTIDRAPYDARFLNIAKVTKTENISTCAMALGLSR